MLAPFQGVKSHHKPKRRREEEEQSSSSSSTSSDEDVATPKKRKTIAPPRYASSRPSFPSYEQVAAQWTDAPGMISELALRECVRMMFWHFLPHQMIALWPNLPIQMSFLVNFNPVSKARMSRLQKLPISHLPTVEHVWQSLTLSYYKYTYNTSWFIQHILDRHPTNRFLQTACFGGQATLVSGGSTDYKLTPNLTLFMFEENQAFVPPSLKSAWKHAHRAIWANVRVAAPTSLHVREAAGKWWRTRSERDVPTPPSSTSLGISETIQDGWRWTHSIADTSELKAAQEINFVSQFLYHVWIRLMDYLVHSDLEHMCLLWLERKSSHMPPSKQIKKNLAKRKLEGEETATEENTPPTPDDDNFDMTLHHFLQSQTLQTMFQLYREFWAKHGG